MNVQRILGTDLGVRSAITYSIYRRFGDSFKFQLDKKEPDWKWISEWINKCADYTGYQAERIKATIIAIEKLNFSNLKYKKFLEMLSNEIQTVTKKRFHVELVDPRYTSQRCRGCGSINPLNRPGSGEYFKCINCGFEDNADVNAAKNIAILCAIKLAKKAIKSQLPWEKKFYILETASVRQTPVEYIDWAVKKISCV